ncbi:MAG: hypothetical protein R8F63_00710 [Acidimicrobiales bacterium]|nr:hypothetical protein [Acidimicrobiales bacterium]
MWENSNDERVLAEAKREIDRCFPDGPPPVLDPFGGGGAIPLEAQRLGLTALSGDLNPVAVLIQKAMLEIPPRFAGRAPVNPDVDSNLQTWQRAQGLAADVEAYGQWMRDRAHEQIGHLYPDATDEDGNRLTPIAWIWARTVESPDPAWNGHVPLVASWTLANKKGKPKVWIEPVVDRSAQSISYEVRKGGEPTHERTVNRGKGICIATGAAIPGDYIKGEGKADRLGEQLMAVVAEGGSGRTYCSVSDVDWAAAVVDLPEWRPNNTVALDPRNIWVTIYGLDEWWKLFTPRQLTALTTFSDLLPEMAAKAEQDAIAAGFADDGIALRDGGDGAKAYAEALVTYLAFTIDKCTDYWSTICSWHNSRELIRNTFGRQAIPMTWDFAETNPFSDSTGNWMAMVDWVQKSVKHLPTRGHGRSTQLDARANVRRSADAVLSTDPPYYDNISYADLSDFFYVWLRRNVADVWPDETATLLTPKADELIANRYRAGSKEAAEDHFEGGMAEFMADVAETHHPTVPSTIYYAYKATETKDGDVRSTGWDTFLQAVIDAGLQVTATWPMRTELGNRLIASGTNALASSIVLACRPRATGAPMASRREFVAALRDELPEAVRVLQSGNIAPVDMAQSTIGPGIKVFSRYAKVVDAEGDAISVSEALSAINDVLGEVLDGEESELDAASRFALDWYTQFGYNPASSGDADSVARAKGTSTGGLVRSGVGHMGGGKFRLLERTEMPEEWSPLHDDTPTVWESAQHLIRVLSESESDAAEMLRQMGGTADRARTLAYLLFQKATDKGWAEEASAYNGLITAWPELQALASAGGDAQGKLV